MMEKPRKPWTASLLTFLQPGFGHLYCGSWTKGIYFYLLSKVAIIILGCFLLWFPFPKINVVISVILGIGFIAIIIKYSVDFARQEGDFYVLKPINKWYFYLLILAIVWAGEGLFLDDFIKNSFARAFKFPSASMIPTVLKGDHVLANNLNYYFKEPERNELVTFLYPEDESKVFLKRIIGLPGDTLQIKDKVLFMNREKVEDQPYTQRIDPGIIDGQINPRDNFGPITVPPNSYFVMGDNRDQSLDSRFFGFVKREKILGRVSVIYWSWDSDASWSEVIRWNRIGLRL